MRRLNSAAAIIKGCSVWWVGGCHHYKFVDNTQSWVRISHGSNKFVIDSNNNDTEVPEDLPEEQALQLKVKDFACRSKAKAKPQRREPVDYSPSIIPMNERKWIDIEPGNSSLSAFEISKKVIHLLRHSQTVQREEDGTVQFWRIKNYLQNQFPQVQHWADDRWILCLAAGGGPKRRYQYSTDISLANRPDARPGTSSTAGPDATRVSWTRASTRLVLHGRAVRRYSQG